MSNKNSGGWCCCYLDECGCPHWYFSGKPCNNFTDCNKRYKEFRQWAKENNIKWISIEREFWK